MSLFFPLKMQLTSRTGSYVNRKWVNSNGTPSDIKASFQPANGEDLQNLPEGARSSNTFKIYTKTKITNVKQGTTTRGDLITFNSIVYEAIHVAPWQNGTMNHYKVIVQEVKE